MRTRLKKRWDARVFNPDTQKGRLHSAQDGSAGEFAGAGAVAGPSTGEVSGDRAGDRWGGVPLGRWEVDQSLTSALGARGLNRSLGTQVWKTKIRENLDSSAVNFGASTSPDLSCRKAQAHDSLQKPSERWPAEKTRRLG